MKIEIDISEEEITKSVAGIVHQAVREKVGHWQCRDYIKDRINALWESNVEGLIIEALNNRDDIRTRIANQLERKIQAQLTIALKAAGQ